MKNGDKNFVIRQTGNIMVGQRKTIRNSVKMNALFLGRLLFVLYDTKISFKFSKEECVFFIHRFILLPASKSEMKLSTTTTQIQNEKNKKHFFRRHEKINKKKLN